MAVVNYHQSTSGFSFSVSIPTLKLELPETPSTQYFEVSPDKEENSLGVKAALSMLKFYKREISPLMANSCRYVPTCSEYSMQAYKKYGVAEGTVLTAWRLYRCNPLGGLDMILLDGSTRRVYQKSDTISHFFFLG